MHTTKLVRSEDFQFDLLSVFPGFDGSDRLGVVSPQPQDGILNAGYIVLACVTAFYRFHRDSVWAGCKYPPYFIFLAPEDSGKGHSAQRWSVPWRSAVELWGQLDVWPDSQWIVTDGTTRSMLEGVLSCKITRLLWPAGLGLPGNTPSLPASLLTNAQGQLRSVLLYSSDGASVQVRVAKPVEDLIQGGVLRLPGLGEGEIETFRSSRSCRRSATESCYTEDYREVSLDTFLKPGGEEQPIKVTRDFR